MVSNILDGKEVAAYFLDKLPQMDKLVKLAIITIGGEGYANKKYIRNKIIKCTQKGIVAIHIDIETRVNEQETAEQAYKRAANIIHELNCDKDFKAIIVQKPYPKEFEGIEQEIISFKDVDGLAEHTTKFIPATPLGIMLLLKHYKIKLQGKHVVVIGRSALVGSPIAKMLDKENATVTVCHSKTNKEDLEFFIKKADIIIAAVGKAKFITKKCFESDQENHYYTRRPVIIDVGINQDENGKLCGDVDYDSVYPYCSYITRVPGGVGPMTIMALILNIYVAAGYNLTQYFDADELYTFNSKRKFSNNFI